jgi:hypothetical protein
LKGVVNILIKRNIAAPIGKSAANCETLLVGSMLCFLFIENIDAIKKNIIEIAKRELAIIGNIAPV